MSELLWWTVLDTYRGRNTDGHTSQLSIQFGDDLPDGLGSTRRGGDQVVKGRAPSTPVLATLAGAVHDELRGGTGVDGRHETFDDTEFFVNDLGERGQAVGSARGIGKDRFSGVLFMVDTHNEHGGIRRGGRDDDTLGTTLQVKRGLFNGREDTGGLTDSVSTGFSPWNVCKKCRREERVRRSVETWTDPYGPHDANTGESCIVSPNKRNERKEWYTYPEDCVQRRTWSSSRQQQGIHLPPWRSGWGYHEPNRTEAGRRHTQASKRDRWQQRRWRRGCPKRHARRDDRYDQIHWFQMRRSWC